MALERLKIQVEQDGPGLRFEDSITALFNPNQLVFSKSVGWSPQGATQRDVPELQFTHGQPQFLTVELLFDTYDSAEEQKTSVRTHTDALMRLTTVETHGDKHRPPVCRLSWGTVGVFFQGVLQDLHQQFVLFTADGTPVRAVALCTFREWRTNADDRQRQDRQSSDITKTRVVRQGDTIGGIAYEAYGDPALWRPIAEENSIENPLHLRPSTLLSIPPLSSKDRARSDRRG